MGQHPRGTGTSGRSAFSPTETQKQEHSHLRQAASAPVPWGLLVSTTLRILGSMSQNTWLKSVYMWGGEQIKPHPGHGILSPTNTQHACTCTQQALNAGPLNTELQGRTWHQLAGPSLTTPKSATSYAPTQQMCLWSPCFREKRRWGFR